MELCDILANLKLYLSVALISAIILTAITDSPVRLASANFIPEQTPSGIQIKSNGAIEGTDKIQRDGNVYTLTGNINSTISILRDGITLDGSGHSLSGNGTGTGVFLQERNAVTLRNININNFQYGIKFTWSNPNYAWPFDLRSNKIFNNTLTNNTYGILVNDFSTRSEYSDNFFANNTYGVVIYSATAVLRSNYFLNNDRAISDGNSAVNEIDTSNMINGKPIYYWFNQHNRAVPSDAGLVILKNCSEITVLGLSLEANCDSILLCFTDNSSITKNFITDSLNGISLYGSTCNKISDNKVRNNKGYGINLASGSSFNAISSNEVAANGNDGIYLDISSLSNTVTENNVTGNVGNGIFFKNIKDSKIFGNTVTLNKGCAIGFGYGPNGDIRKNILSLNGKGFWISNAYENTIILNNVTHNREWGIEMEGSQKNNIIHHNNFVNNSFAETQQARIADVWTYPDIYKPGGTTPKIEAGASNVWDNGKEGNYWSDYLMRYPNASEGGKSVGNTCYLINVNNMDRYPLMVLYDILFTPEPQPTTSSATVKETASPQTSAASTSILNASDSTVTSSTPPIATQPENSGASPSIPEFEAPVAIATALTATVVAAVILNKEKRQKKARLQKRMPQKFFSPFAFF